MQTRIERQSVYNLRPELPKALISLAGAASSTIGDQLSHLIKIRCSQINGCAFCLHMHSAEARSHGEKQYRLDTLSAWQNTTWFSDRERAALAFSESLTNLANGEISDEVFSKLKAQFSDQEIVDLTAAIVAINGWNRVVAAMHFIPEEVSG